MNFSYNARLQLTHFEFFIPAYNADTYRSDYQYYADGKVRFISDARRWFNGEEGHHNFDRAYSYDHVARLTLALTGNEARGGTTADGPYKETYQHDVWGHMTKRVNRIWSKPLDWFETTYVNNRNQLWYYTYDADGNPTNEGSFDAAGRKTTYSSSRFYQTGTNSNATWNPSMVTNTYDGDGQLTKQSEAAGADHWDAYFVRSTVLRGAVILWTEVQTNPVYAPGWSNTIRFGSIYANGDRIAQVYNGSGFDGEVTFEFPEPFTGRRRGIEPDPLGQEVGPSDPGPDDPGNVGSYPQQHEFGNIEDMNLGCTLDGITTACSTVARMMNEDAAAKEYLIHDRQGWHIEQYPIVPLGLGMFVMERPYFRNVNDNEGPGTVFDTEEVFFTFQPQKTLTEDDPKTISSQGSKNCQFTISFESGTFYEGNRNLPNGPGEIQYMKRAYLGLGFTVSGTTRGGGGIGRIGSEVNPSNPKGQWTLDQYTSNYSKQNGEFVTIKGRVQQGGGAWQDIDLTGYHFATDWTNRFSRYDHPALLAGVPDTYKNQAFLIKVFRGKEVCQAEFHIIQRGNEIHWGRGAQGVWPK